MVSSSDRRSAAMGRSFGRGVRAEREPACALVYTVDAGSRGKGSVSGIPWSLCRRVLIWGQLP